MIRLQAVGKTYGETTVLSNVSLTVHRGEFIALVGRSGSGKSKLLHLLGGLELPTSGTVSVFGRDIAKLADGALSTYRKETVGFVFQDYILDEKKTVLENVLLPLLFTHVPISERKEAALKCLSQVHMADMAQAKTSVLSGGQKQRVAIARALMNQPKIILADEPTGNLDSKMSDEILQLLKELNTLGYTIVMVTHNLEQLSLVDRVLLMKDGVLTEQEQVVIS